AIITRLLLTSVSKQANRLDPHTTPQSNTCAVLINKQIHAARVLRRKARASSPVPFHARSCCVFTPDDSSTGSCPSGK
ncbi:hypothetical protein CH063_03282, partial [Colletotrichum higginsianum]